MTGKASLVPLKIVMVKNRQIRLLERAHLSSMDHSDAIWRKAPVVVGADRQAGYIFTGKHDANLRGEIKVSLAQRQVGGQFDHSPCCRRPRQRATQYPPEKRSANDSIRGRQRPDPD